MHFIIIGNGPAGTSAAKKIRQLNKLVKITIITQEKYPYYARPRLHELLEEDKHSDSITIFKPSWYEQNNINLLLNTKIKKINTKDKVVSNNEFKIKYDKLLLAVGANPFVPPMKIDDNVDVYTLHTVEDIINIKNSIKDKNDIIIIGGGLLGLELAACFEILNKKVNLIETNSHLLPRHLEKNKGNKLKNILEKSGITFYFSEYCDTITKKEEKIAVFTKNNNTISGDLVIIAAGVRPHTKLANSAGLKCNRGILVNNFLQTSDPNIYSAGNCIEFEGKMWGFVKSSIEQGNIAGENMLNENKLEYTGTKIDPILKVKNIDLHKL